MLNFDVTAEQIDFQETAKALWQKFRLGAI
jgi:hypothetical protein